MEVYAQVRRAVYVEGISQRDAAENAGVLVPPGYRRSRPPARPKLDPFLGIIDRILEEDKSQPAKQHHTAKRIFERLREMFAPLRHDPGHAQGDFGEAFAVIAGEEQDPLLRDGSAAQRCVSGAREFRSSAACRVPLAEARIVPTEIDIIGHPVAPLSHETHFGKEHLKLENCARTLALEIVHTGRGSGQLLPASCPSPYRRPRFTSEKRESLRARRRR